MNIRSRLLLLVFAVWMPAVGAFGVLAASAYSRDEAAAKARVQQLAEHLSTTVERELDKKVVLATTLAASAALGTGNYAQFHGEAANAIRHYPGNWVLVVSEREQLLNTLRPGAAPIPRVDGSPLLRGQPPDVFFATSGTVTGRPVLAMFAEVTGARHGPLNVGVAFEPSQLHAFLDSANRPDDSVAAIIDREHRVMARSRNGERWLGQSATGRLLEMARAGQSGFVYSRTLDGVPSLTFLSGPNRYGWSASVAMPTTSLHELALSLTARVLGAAAALLLIGLITALFAARRISGPMLALQESAVQIGRNEVPEVLHTGLAEADAVSAALHRAAAERRHAADILEARVAQAVEQTEAAQAGLFESQKREAIGRLTGGLAHDFNNVLQTITMGLQVIDRSTGPGTHRRALDAAFRACGKAADLIRQMLTFGRAQALKPQAVALDDFMLKALELTTRAVGPKISLQADVQPGTRPAWVDPIQFELALLNLVFNARDAMPDGGNIVISARDAGPEEAEDAGLAGQEAFVCMEVRDTGSGMDAATLARASEPFFTTKPVGSGSGLGLAQVFSFARQSGGEVRLESELNHGTRVRVYLPVAEAGGTPASEVPAPVGARRPLDLLMVEDDVLVSAVVVPALESVGHRVTLCRRADDAVGALLSGRHFDVVFSDVVMPGGMDGHDLALWCQTHRPGLGVLLATGYSAKAEGSTAALLRKPYGMEELLDTLERMASSSQARARVDALAAE